MGGGVGEHPDGVLDQLGTGGRPRLAHRLDGVELGLGSSRPPARLPWWRRRGSAGDVLGRLRSGRRPRARPARPSVAASAALQLGRSAAAQPRRFSRLRRLLRLLGLLRLLRLLGLLGLELGQHQHRHPAAGECVEVGDQVTGEPVEVQPGGERERDDEVLVVSRRPRSRPRSVGVLAPADPPPHAGVRRSGRRAATSAVRSPRRPRCPASAARSRSRRVGRARRARRPPSAAPGRRGRRAAAARPTAATTTHQTQSATDAGLQRPGEPGDGQDRRGERDQRRQPGVVPDRDCHGHPSLLPLDGSRSRRRGRRA